VCTETWHATTVVISCSGVVDMLTAPHMGQLIATVLDKRPSVVIIDLTDTSMFASCGMSLLVETSERLPEDASLIVVADGPVTRRPLELVGLSAFLTLRSTLGEALGEVPLTED
jgi:anti-anti-sigma factor